MIKLAIVEKAKSNIDYNKYFNFPENVEINKYALTTKKVQKVLKRDIDIDINPDNYDFILTVGSEATKFFVKTASVTVHNGYLLEDKYIPVISPAMVILKPEARPMLEKAAEQVQKILNGEYFTSQVKTVLIEDEIEAEQYLSNIIKIAPELVALDSETSSFDPRSGEILGISIAYTSTEGAYISAEVLTDINVEKLQVIINNSTIIMHNAKFDKKWFTHQLGLTFPKVVEDTILMHYCLDETQGSHDLKQLAIKYTDLGDYDRGLEDFKTQYCKSNRIKVEDFSYAFIPFNIIGEYAAKDALATFLLYKKFNPLVRNSDKLNYVYRQVLLPASDFILDMEEFGVPFDIERLKKAQIFLENKLFETKTAFYARPELEAYHKEYGVELNVNSPIQLRKLLFDFLKLEKTGAKTGTGADSTDAEVLSELASQSDIPKLILEIKQEGKVKSTYVDKILIGLDKDSRLRTGFNLTSTTSGRLSSSGKLNMQQLPRDNPIVKGCIKARPNYKIVSQDLSTAEMYYAAVLSKDKNLMKVFQSGGDFHSTVAKMVFNLKCSVEEVKALYPGYRQAAKAISFGINIEVPY